MSCCHYRHCDTCHVVSIGTVTRVMLSDQILRHVVSVGIDTCHVASVYFDILTHVMLSVLVLRRHNVSPGTDTRLVGISHVTLCVSGEAPITETSSPFHQLVQSATGLAGLQRKATEVCVTGHSIT